MTKADLQKYVDVNPFEQLTTAVYRLLFEEIETFHIKPGEKINIAQLASDLSISRTPVIEASKLLEKIGLTEKKDGCSGWYVTGLGRTEAVDLCVARATIEAKAAFLCAQRGACPHIDEMKRLAEKYRDVMDAGGSCEEAEALDLPFHKLILEDCGNKYLADSYQNISKGLIRYQLFAKRSIMDEQNGKIRHTVKAQHLSIVNAIKLCMPEFAEKEMENHMNTCFAIIMSSVDKA